MSENRATLTHLPIVLRRLTVVAVADVTRSMRRVTLGGPELQGFERDGRALPGFRSDGFDDHVKLFFPPPDGGAAVLPGQGDGQLVWSFPHGARPLHRNYTVRRLDLEAGVIDIDLVRHEGGAAAWAESCAVGDTLHIAGPKSTLQLPDDVAVHLLVADDTALPAVARFAEDRRRGRRQDGRREDGRGGPRAIAVIEVGGVEDQQDLGPDLEVVWVHRHGPPGPGTLLADAVRQLDLGEDPTAAYAWVVGELGSNHHVRRHLLDERRLPPANLDVTGYWRSGATDEDHAELHEMVDLLTPMALRTAATLGLADQIAAGTDTVPALAAAVGADGGALDALVRFLASKRVVRAGPQGRLRLGPIGELLRSNGHGDQLRLDGAQGHMQHAFFGLPHAVRSGAPGYAAMFGEGFWDRLARDDGLARSFDEQLAGWAEAWIPAVLDVLPLPECGDVVDVGGGAGRLLAAALDRRPELTGTVVERGATAARAAEALRRHGPRARVVDRSFFDPLPDGAALYVLAQVLHDWSDDDAARILRRCATAAAGTGTIALVERVPDHAAPDHDHVYMDLLMLNLFGSRERTRPELDALADAAGLRILAQHDTPSGLSVLMLRSR